MSSRGQCASMSSLSVFIRSLAWVYYKLVWYDVIHDTILVHRRITVIAITNEHCNVKCKYVHIIIQD